MDNLIGVLGTGHRALGIGEPATERKRYNFEKYVKVCHHPVFPPSLGCFRSGASGGVLHRQET